MTYGIDTDFLVALEVSDHPAHRPANNLLDGLLAANHDFALAPQVLAEFIHVVTDARRVPLPLTVEAAVARAEFWWCAREVRRIFPNAPAVETFFSWLKTYRLGRKRLLDTLLAASLDSAGVTLLITNNQVDYTVFQKFQLIGYTGGAL